MKKNMILACALVFAQVVAFAQEAAGTDPSLKPNATNPAVEAKLSEPDGVAITIKPDGTFQIFSRGSGEYMFNNPKAKRIALANATKRAKANLAKFMKEKISSKEGLDDVTKNTLSMTGDGQVQNQNASMESLETASESIRNEAEAILTGVITLNDKLVPSGGTMGEAQVTVGVSSKTLKAANMLQNGIENSLKPGNPQNGEQPKPVAPGIPNTSRVRQNGGDF